MQFSTESRDIPSILQKPASVLCTPKEKNIVQAAPVAPVAAPAAPQISRGKTIPSPGTLDTRQQIQALLDRKVPWDEWPERLLWRYYKAVLTIQDDPKVPSVAHRRNKIAGEIRNEIATRYRPWATSLAMSYAMHRLPTNVSIVDGHDLTQEACLAMWQVVPDYNPSYGTNFPQFAYPRVSGAIIDCLRAVQDFPRDIARARRCIYAKQMQLRTELGHRVSLEELIEHFPELEETVRDNLVWARVFNQAETIDSHSGDRVSILNSVVCHRTMIEEDIRRERVNRIDRVLDSLPDPRMRTIIYCYYYASMPQHDIASSLGMNVNTVVTLKKAAENHLRENLGRDFFRKVD